jgi:hypothetical protein
MFESVQAPLTRRKRCEVGNLYRAVPIAARHQLDRLFADPAITHAVIAHAITTEASGYLRRNFTNYRGRGWTVGRHAVSSHRRDLCGCKTVEAAELLERAARRH